MWSTSIDVGFTNIGSDANSSHWNPGATPIAANAFSGVAFGSLLFAVKMMDEIPFASLTPAAVTAKIKSYVGPLPLGPTAIDCTGKLYPADTNVCSDYDQFYQYEGQGQYKLLEGWSN